MHEIYKSDIVSQMPLPLGWRGGDVDPAILNFCSHVAHAMDGRYAYPRTEFVVSSTALMDELVKHMVDLVRKHGLLTILILTSRPPRQQLLLRRVPSRIISTL